MVKLINFDDSDYNLDSISRQKLVSCGYTLFVYVNDDNTKYIILYRAYYLLTKEALAVQPVALREQGHISGHAPAVLEQAIHECLWRGKKTDETTPWNKLK